MDSANNIEHVAVSGEQSQSHVYWRAAQWTPISHSSNRICTRTNATPSPATSRQTSYISVGLGGDVADVDVYVDVDVADATSVHQFYLLCVLFDIYRSPAYVYCGLELTGVCYACVDVELFICIPGPTFSSPAISSPAFSRPAFSGPAFCGSACSIFVWSLKLQ